MAVPLSSETWSRAKQHWTAVLKQINPSTTHTTDKDTSNTTESIKFLTTFFTNNTPLSDNNTVSTNTHNVSNEEFVSIMNEIDNETKSIDHDPTMYTTANTENNVDDECYKRHKDSPRMDFITAPVCLSFSL